MSASKALAKAGGNGGALQQCRIRGDTAGHPKTATTVAPRTDLILIDQPPLMEAKASSSRARTEVEASSGCTRAMLVHTSAARALGIAK